MDLQQIRTFLAVAEELHFGRAAERLNMAQPPVSRSVQQLERSLGVALFDRSTRRVALTAVGESLVDPARAVLDAADRFRATAKAAAKGEIGHVRFAYAGASSNAMVGRVARAVKHRHPGIRFELLSQRFADLAMGSLVRGEIDIALGRWDHLPIGIDSRVLASEQLVLAVSETHRLASQETVRAEDLRGETFVSLPAETGSVLLDRLRTLGRRGGFTAEVAQYAPDTWTVMSLVSAEVGCSLTLSSVVESIADPHLRFLPLAEPMDPVHLRMAWRSGRTDRALDAVLAAAASVVPSPAQRNEPG
ncbi:MULTISPECIES: LysR family transcriptional regulator [unclassified Rathayibacter]|uniref:LysR family transcriptional regulator n=1 Tax=unclassified Rathayibacter TaxID=2609250 RepID=UPI0006F523CA|nr:MULTISPECIES: LysR substrate-binding domain-containing protein [unclassified Rathayibacter]KQQ01284.1 LysR family transcriptional regulator [Rathayibacter sp. Leaf294]KQS11315.1 LysR family transcriptional regulator [Rathayibacter sp. Leaf185]